VYLWYPQGTIVRLHGIKTRHTCQPLENQSTAQNATTKQHKGGAKTHGQNRIIEQIHFKVLRANKTFQWGAEQQQTFEDLRNYLEEATIMAKPSPKVDLLLYIVATNTAVSTVLVEEWMEAGALKQFPNYYVSEALGGLKLFYSEMEKMAYAVVMAKRKL
jgi:hypothetical protein